MKDLIRKSFNYRTCLTLMFINFMFSLFLDTMTLYTYYHHERIESIEGFVYIAVANVAFVVFAILSIVKFKKEHIFNEGQSIPRALKKYYPLIITLLAITVMAVLKFDTLPIYDANLYYGSFIQIYKLYKFTIASTIGAINVWNNVFMGTALFVSPFECFAVGEMTGTYIANTILFIVTLVVLYKFLEVSLVKSNKWMLTFLVIAFAFMPYSFNLITYFCPDYYLELYFIWLLYAYKKDNHLMISFIGFLLCFTKTSGALMYALFVFFMYVLSNLINNKEDRFAFIKPKNWPIGKFALWVIPAIIYFVAFMTKEKFQLQVYEDQGTATYGFNMNDIIMQSLQNYVYGYRWAILALTGVAIIAWGIKAINARKRGKAIELVVHKEYVPQLISIVIATVAFSTFLCFFQMSHCPRYTTVNNVAFILLLAMAICIFTDKQILKSLTALLFAVLMSSQVYMTTDPSITKLCEPLELGNGHVMYNLALNKLMSKDAEFPWLPDTLGDVYVYNEEYSVYDELLNDTLKHYDPQENIYVLVFRVDKYEIHPGGMHYWMYWDTKTQKQSYKKTKNSIKLRGGTVKSRYIKEVDYDEFYLIVPYREDEELAVKRCKQAGYIVDDSFVASSKYGSMDTYKMVLDDEHREARDKKKEEKKKKKAEKEAKAKAEAAKKAKEKSKSTSKSATKQATTAAAKKN